MPGLSEKNYFLIRRLHSLSGLIPLGAFVVFHLGANSLIRVPTDTPGGMFQKGVDGIHALGPLVYATRSERAARDEVSAFLAARSERVAPEVAATHLRNAAHALEELLGVIAPEDLLANVFSEFCIGK